MHRLQLNKQFVNLAVTSATLLLTPGEKHPVLSCQSFTSLCFSSTIPCPVVRETEIIRDNKR
jgi:hypothetical protein